MTRRRRPGGRGVTLVEFSIVAPVALMVVFGILEFSNATHYQSLLTDAARQGARQAAANAVSSDNPFGTFSSASNTCSGTALDTNNLTPGGCLTDGAVLYTIQSDLASVTSAVNITQSCTSSNPPPGQAYVCITPSDGTTGSTTGTTTSCPTTTLPQPSTESDRKTEWSSGSGNGTLKGCYTVQVTITFTYRPFTPLVGAMMGGGVTMKSTTSIIAEY
jgi:Flp pilus assembly protein TadG